MSERFLQLVADPRVVWGVIAGGFLVLGVALLLLMLTRLGQSNPLRKCVLLSLAAHMLLAALLSTIHVATTDMTLAGGPVMRITRIDGVDAASTAAGAAPVRAWEGFAAASLAEFAPTPVARMAESGVLPPERTMAAATGFIEHAVVDRSTPALASFPAPPRLHADDPARHVAARTAAPIEAIAPTRDESPQALLLPAESAKRLPAEAASSLEPRGGVGEAETIVQPSLAPRIETPLTELSQPSVFAEASSARSHLPAPGPRADNDAASVGPPRETTASVGDLIRRQAPASGSGADPAGGGLEIAPAALVANRPGENVEVPEIYRARVAPDRALRAQEQGGSLETEAAVDAALAWLAANQSNDGRWEPRRHGGGREDKTLGQDRGGAGAKADTGVTGLALLAFLGAGHSHLHGDHRKPVARGLEFLMRSQGADGNLGGDAELYAFMYCHGMATIALSEAYGLTRDNRLEQPLRRAVSYTLSAQHPTAGGWRYRPQDKQGDTSQLGWQLMALKSAKLAGIGVPRSAEEGMQRFLRSVAVGKHGGLACYRINERESATMTAEALVCRNFLGLGPDDPAAAAEAGDYILRELPGSGRPNFYYWYYGTLAMHQLQGDYWQQWNESLRKTLLDSQVAEGPHAGSWNTDSLWAGYGGRVFTTSLGALCLEVYYRFLPLYDREAAIPGRRH